LFCQKTTANQLPVNLIGTFPNLGDFGVAHEPLDPVILAVAVTAK
jgi:hypothetical protein